MSKTIRTKTSVYKASSALPGLNRPKSRVTTPEEVREIKLKIQAMENEKRQLKSKTTRMRQILADRNKAIDNVFKEQVTEKQKIQTASDTTLQQLKENIVSLENTLKSRQDELRRLAQTDRLAFSDELKEEVKVLYLEHQRLLKQSKAVKEGESIVETELNRVKNEIGERKLNQTGIKNLESELSDIVDKIVSYKRSEIKLENDEIAKFLAANPKKAEAKENELNSEIQNLQEEIDKLHNEISESEQQEEQMIANLQNVIDEQTAKINEQVEKIKEQERQEVENDNQSGEKSEEQEEVSEYKQEKSEKDLSESSIHESEQPKEEEKKSHLVLGEKAPRSETFMTNDGTPMRTVELN